MTTLMTLVLTVPKFYAIGVCVAAVHILVDMLRSPEKLRRMPAPAALVAVVCVFALTICAALWPAYLYNQVRDKTGESD